MIEEIWKPVKGYEGIYEVSNLGRLKSLPRLTLHCRSKVKYFRKEHICRMNAKDSSGYYHVMLTTNDGLKDTRKLHRLVAEAFLPNPENKPEVNHKNGIKTDNRVSELEWVTRSENHKHAFAIGLKSHKGVKHPCSKLTEHDVIKIRSLYVPRKYSSIRLAKEFGVSTSSILGIINKETWQHI